MNHGGKIRYCGVYKLASDAAFAHDKFLRHVGGPSAKTNFASVEDYKDARANEVKRVGVAGADFDAVQAYMAKKIDTVVSSLASEDTNKECGRSHLAKKKKITSDVNEDTDR